MSKKEKLHNILTLKTIGSKIILCCIIISALLTIFSLKAINVCIVELESRLIGSRLEADISHLEDIITGDDKDKEWHIEDGFLYCGDVCIGDATEKNANLAPFFETEEKTGTFCYSFMKCSDEGLEWTGDNETGYMQGHFIRVAGSTKNPAGESIVGTYMDKKVADILDTDGYYKGEANVAGGMIYCVYKTLENNAGDVVGAMVVGRSMNELMKEADAARAGVSLTLFLFIVLAGLIIITITSRWTNAITLIDKYLERIQNGELPEDKLDVFSNDEIGLVAQSVNNMVDGLKEKDRIDTELKTATSIQTSLLPAEFPRDPVKEGYNVYALMHPAKEVGGDLYDFFKVDDDHLALVVADVSGKGIPASLFMAISKTILKSRIKEGVSLDQVAYSVNNILCDGNELGLFVTALIGIVDLRTGVLDLLNAGHTPALLYDEGKFEYYKMPPCIALGVMDNMSFVTKQIQLNPGDKFIMYTDGVPEATDINNELYGEDRLLEYLNNNSDANIHQLSDGLFDDVMDFTGDAPQFDDVTLLAFEYIGK